jgi:hypothetical protein
VSSRAPLTEFVAKGRWGTVEYAVRPSGEAPAKDFFEKDCEEIREKGKNEPLATASARFAVLFQQMADYGRVSPKRFKSEMGRLFAFRNEVRNVQIRFPCFQDGNRWILTHGFIKPGARKGQGQWPENEVQHANDTMNEYFQRKERAAGGR